MKEQLHSNRKPVIACIGDSIVEGYPYMIQDSWVSHARRLREGQNREELWINSGISGETTAQIRRRLQSDALRFQPELVIISCGTNDFIFLEGPMGEVRSAFENITSMAREVLSSGANVMIAAPPLTIPHMASRRWSDGTDYGEVNRKLEDLRMQVCRWCGEQNENGEHSLRGAQGQRTIFLDVLGQYRRWTEAEGEAEYYTDGLHPTPRGYERIAAFVCEKLPHMNL